MFPYQNYFSSIRQYSIMLSRTQACFLAFILVLGYELHFLLFKKYPTKFTRSTTFNFSNEESYEFLIWCLTMNYFKSPVDFRLS